MAKAVVDPAELRQFANDLRRFNQDLDNHMRILQTRMHRRVGEIRSKPSSPLNLKRPSARLVGFGSIRGARPVPSGKAERIEEYLKQR